MNVLYFYIFLLAHPYLAMWWKSFEQADRKSWEAFIPGYNYFIAFKIGCKKPWWVLLMIFPGVHLVMWSVANTSYVRRFGYFSLMDTVQGIFFPYLLMFKIAQAKDKALPDTNWANSKEVADREWGDHLALFLSLPVLGHVIALGISAVTRAEPGKRTKVKEWGDSILFAIVAASIIRTYVFEPFQIPTGSMEKTLLVGDFLFVNKLSYGPKVPVTPMSYPLVHNTVPWVNIKSYTKIETSNYTRLPGFGGIERNDVVVFNYPSGDTAVYDPRMPNGLMGHDYHDIVNFEAKRLFGLPKHEYDANFYGEALELYRKAYSSTRQKNAKRADSLRISNDSIHSIASEFVYGKFIEQIDFWKSKARTLLGEDKKAYDRSTGEMIDHYGLIPRPVDKRENYIKRCVGVPGDWLEIKNAILYVNDAPAFVADHQNLYYKCPDLQRLTKAEMQSKYDIDTDTDYDFEIDPVEQRRYFSGIHMNLASLDKLKKDYPNVSFELDLEPQLSDDTAHVFTNKELVNNLELFPKDLYVNNTMTNVEKFQIPAKGQTIEISSENIAWYRRIITAYEGHQLEEKADGIYIDGKKATSYTFAMNYYWMMGDNRYRSLDSRKWGFVPEDHIVGKASMVWFSKNPFGGIRWNRMFTMIK